MITLWYVLAFLLSVVFLILYVMLCMAATVDDDYRIKPVDNPAPAGKMLYGTAQADDKERGGVAPGRYRIRLLRPGASHPVLYAGLNYRWVSADRALTFEFQSIALAHAELALSLKPADYIIEENPSWQPF